MPSAFSMFTIFNRSHLETGSSFFAAGELNGTFCLWPTLCPVRSSNLPDWSTHSCLSCWLWTMIKQSSKQLPTSARGKTYTCLLIQIAISNVTLRAEPNVPWRKALVACHHWPTEDPNQNADFSSLLYVLSASDHFWGYPAAPSNSYNTSHGSLSKHASLSIKDIRRLDN